MNKSHNHCKSETMNKNS